MKHIKLYENWDDDSHTGSLSHSEEDFDYMFGMIINHSKQSITEKWLDLIGYARNAPTPRSRKRRSDKIMRWVNSLPPDQKEEIKAEQRNQKMIKARELEDGGDVYGNDYWR